MAVPTYEDMMRPVLELLAANGETQFRAMPDQIADAMSISEADRAQKIGSGQLVVTNRVGWAITYLVQAGVVSRPRRGYSEITPRGRQLLSETTGPISNANLAQFAEFQEFRLRSRKTNPSKEETASGANTQPVPADAETPKEIIDATVATVHSALVAEILDRVMQLTPKDFESLVLKVLGAMQYGTAGHIESTGDSADAGIDGVISQDPLGLDRIYVQAKRYARDRTVGRPAMQAFVGALQGQQADRGVFIATCTFTREALDYADRVGVRIIPINGIELAELMLKHRVGVQTDYVATLLRLDEDFYDSL
ncbi:MAG: restriction endonuclease [Nocardioidaceae bacterium]|nr:restriction endonuclease [Nocardioidaceae bacterium]